MVIKFKIDSSIEDINEVINILKDENINFEKVNYFDQTFLILQENLNIKFNHQSILEVIESDYPFKLVNKEINNEDLIVSINDLKIGANQKFTLIAGVCSIENYDDLYEVAASLKASGLSVLRAGAFKPRTSPYSFLGLKNLGLKYLSEVKNSINIPTVSEIMDISDLDLYNDVDILQVGARNMQNFSLLEKLGKVNKPIILKRGFSNTIEEWLLAAEYIVKNGNPNVILCERGIRTFEKYTRNTLDLSVIPIIKSICNLPIIIDPSHATGKSELVIPMSKAALIAGADGLMLEVSSNPKEAISDGRQSLTLKEYKDLVNDLKSLSKAIKREI